MTGLKVAADRAVRRAGGTPDGRGEVARLVRAPIVCHCDQAGTLPPTNREPAK
ncbi:MAG: hypothetical protein OXG81_13585 [Acidobacteria bacterium]|nr:hypothetical protein [Acidobacteriota bacterium]